VQYFFSFRKTGPTDLFHPSPAPHFKTFQVFLIYFPKSPIFSTIKFYAPNEEFVSFFLIFESNFLVKITTFLLNTVFAMASLDLTSRVLCVCVCVFVCVCVCVCACVCSRSTGFHVENVTKYSSQHHFLTLRQRRGQVLNVDVRNQVITPRKHQYSYSCSLQLPT